MIQPAKNRNIPYFNAHSNERNDCAITNVKRRFTATVMLCPADLVSNGNISLGIVQPSGPHDHPKAKTNRQITITTKIENPFDSSSLFPNFTPRIMATTTCLLKRKVNNQQIWTVFHDFLWISVFFYSCLS